MAEFRALEPPAHVEDLHSRALVVMDRLIAAEEAIADQAAAADTFADLNALWTPDNTRKFLAADEEAYALCQAAQAEFNTTDDSVVLAGTPWIPVEMREVVRVALACDLLDTK